MAEEPKKIKTPLLVKVIRTYVRFTSSIAPILSKKLGYKLFFRAFKFPFKPDELNSIKEASLFTIDYREQKLQGYKWGNGKKTILCMHGWSGRAAQFYQFINPLIKKEYTVIAFDAPGHGKSEGTYSSLVEYKEIITLLHHEYKFQNIIAHSMGAAATLLAVKDGLSVTKLVLISPPVLPQLILDEFCLRIGAKKYVGEYIQLRIEEMYNATFESFFPESYLPLENFPKTIVIHDTQDIDVPFTNGQRLKEIVPEIELFKTEGLGHTRILRNEKVIEKSINFIND